MESLIYGINEAKEFISGLSNNQVLGIASGVGAAGLLAGGIIAASGNKSSSKKKKSNKSKSGRARDRKFISKQKHELAYQRRKRKLKTHSHQKYYKSKKKKSSSSKRKGVHYTKKGQPYILLRSGKARFIKKRSKK